MYICECLFFLSIRTGQRSATFRELSARIICTCIFARFFWFLVDRNRAKCGEFQRNVIKAQVCVYMCVYFLVVCLIGTGKSAREFQRSIMKNQVCMYMRVGACDVHIDK